MPQMQGRVEKAMSAPGVVSRDFSSRTAAKYSTMSVTEELAREKNCKECSKPFGCHRRSNTTLGKKIIKFNGRHAMNIGLIGLGNIGFHFGTRLLAFFNRLSRVCFRSPAILSGSIVDDDAVAQPLRPRQSLGLTRQHHALGARRGRALAHPIDEVQCLLSKKCLMP